MAAPGEITHAEVLRAVLAGLPVRVAAWDRDSRFLLDPDPNRAVSSSPGARRVADFFEFYGDPPSAIDAVRTAFAGEEVRLRREFGGATYAATFTPRRDSSGQVDAVLAVAMVTSQEVHVAQALAGLPSRDRRIFDSPMMGLVYWSDTGAIINANDSFLEMVGYTRDDLAGGLIDWQAMTPPEHRGADQAALGEMHEKGRVAPYEKEFVRKDGSRITVLTGGSSWTSGHKAGVGFVVDISERKRQERKRHDAEETLRRVLDSVPVVLWSVDRDGIFTLSLGRGLRALGLEPGQVLGQSAFDVYAGVPEITAAIRRGLEGEEFSQPLHVGDLEFDTMFTPLLDQGGAVVGLLGVSIDVTERRRAEVEQAQLRAQLLQAQKLESLGLLAGGIAHDFNNILSVILGGASTALLTIPEEDPAREDIENVVAAAQRAAALTRQMLAYSGKAHAEIRPIDLSLQVREIAGLLETTLPKKVRLRLELAPGLPAIDADVAHIQQITMNLVINGAEAIGDQQGTVRVTTGTQSIDEPSAKSLFATEGVAPGNYVFLEVDDTGCGMDETTKSKIFDPFFTTKFTGRGLGLAAVLGIVRAHGGAIAVHSNPGEGTSFKVLFPAIAEPARIERRPAARDYRGTGLVLVIDDDPGVRLTTRRMLESFGFSVIDAEDGQAGAEAFAARASEVVLVIVDMTMPKMSGEETFAAIHHTRSDVPVVLMSGYDEVEATRRFAHEGLAGFIEKPFTPLDLAGKLVRVLGSK
jgi:PAS domain S-box-containing protein